MNATKQPQACQKELFNPLSSMGTQMAGILVFSHFFQLLLKLLGQAGPIAQFLAGIVLGPSGLSHIQLVGAFFFQVSSANYYEVVSTGFRVLFVFVIGLDTDIPYLRRHLRLASILASGGSIVCCIFGAAFSISVLHLLGLAQFAAVSHPKKGNKVSFAIIVMLFLANSASPVVVRLAAELKYATTDVGRLAICSALINELSCMFLFVLYNFFKKGVIKEGFFSLLITAAVVAANKYLAMRFNRKNRNQKYLTNTQMFLFISLVIAPGIIIELMSYNSMIYSFLIGILFPREGKSARTLLHKLNYCVHTFVLPIYFGYIGFQFDVKSLKNYENIFMVVSMVVLSFAGKISGTLAACHYLKIPPSEGVVFALLLNLRGHGEVVLVGYGPKFVNWFSPALHNSMLISVVLNTLIAGPVVAYIVGKERDLLNNRPVALELLNPDAELRMLACLYGSRHVPAAVGLISALSGSRKAPITAYLMHLVELPEKRRTNGLLYHQLKDGDFSDEEDYGGNDVLEINDAVDSFTTDKGILIRQVKAVSSIDSLYEDVCNGAEDLRSSIVILPFHKHQRIDGKMESGKEGIRTTNQKVLRLAPCSVGIIVDKGLPGVPQLLGSENVQHVVTLFFGGPDDREALACSRRISTHPHINLTVIKFQQPPNSDNNFEVVELDSARQKDDHEFLMAISDETENQIDIAYLADFYNRYVTSGKVGFIEKYVCSGEETMTILRDMADMYSLFIVGKGSRGHSAMITGMSDWEECPELGTVGDLLASEDFNISGSVLVIQQQRHAKQDLMDDNL